MDVICYSLLMIMFYRRLHKMSDNFFIFTTDSKNREIIRHLMQCALDNIDTWAFENGFTFSFPKTIYIYFFQESIQQLTLHYIWNGREIEQVFDYILIYGLIQIKLVKLHFIYSKSLFEKNKLPSNGYWYLVGCSSFWLNYFLQNNH